MGQLQKEIATSTINMRNTYRNEAGAYINNVVETATDIVSIAQNLPVVTLAKTWIGIGTAGLFKKKTESTPFLAQQASQAVDQGTAESQTWGRLDRFDYTKLYSLQLGDYFMPMSQTFTLQARKRLNVSALVDGPDIIQQTRKEAKTIDCSLRITLREAQESLKIVEAVDGSTLNAKVAELAAFLREFYEDDAIFAVRNDMINNTFGVTYVFMTEYKFTPRVGMFTYDFNFSLTEVKFGETRDGKNLIAFDLRELNSDT